MIDSGAEPLARHIAMDDRLRLGRYSRSLQLRLEAVIEVDGFQSADLWDSSVTFGCEDTLLLPAFWNEGAPVIAVDAALEELWTARGLGSVAVEDQATARSHRMGQRDPVTVYRLVTEGSIEEKILDLHASKRNLAEDLLGGMDTARPLDLDALRGMLEA